MFQRVKNLLKSKIGFPSVNDSFKRLSILGYNPSEIIDIGAHKGHWSINIHKHYPEAKIFMFEPIEKYFNELTTLAESIGNDSIAFNYLLSSKSDVELKFYINESVSSVLEEHYISSNIEIKNILTKSLDDIIELKTNNALLKIDVQGHELEVLKGAVNTLKNIECIQMEISLIDINKNAPLIEEVLSVMKQEYGFILYDITEMIRRPLDQALWQVDVIFIKMGSNILSSKKYE